MKKMRIAFCLLAMIVLPMSVQAFDSSWRGNWLVGASLGYGNRNSSLNSTLLYTVPAVPPNITGNITRDYNDSGMIWGLFAGYQAIRDQWLLGGEFDLDWHNFDETQSYAFSDTNNILGWNATARYKRNAMMGLVARVGYAIVPYFMPYVRFGLELGNDKLDATFVNRTFFPLGVNIGQRQWVYRFLSGVGVEIPLLMTCGGSIRFEYNYHSKGRTLKADTIIADNLFIPEFSTSMQPKDNTVRVGLAWNFF